MNEEVCGNKFWLKDGLALADNTMEVVLITRRRKHMSLKIKVGTPTIYSPACAQVFMVLWHYMWTVSVNYNDGITFLWYKIQ